MVGSIDLAGAAFPGAGLSSLAGLCSELAGRSRWAFLGAGPVCP